MTLTDRELMHQALEALGHTIRTTYADARFDAVLVNNAITALRERLAQPEQKPFFTEANGFPQTFVPKQEQSPLDRMAENARELGLDYEPVDTKVNSEAIPKQISEQEPVAWANQANLVSASIERNRGGQGDTHTWSETPNAYHTVPLYTTPPRCPNCASLEAQNTELDAKLAEMEKGEPVQEPVAMRYDFDGYGYQYIDSGSGSNWQTRIKDGEPLYTTPPRREWVGLTDEEIESCNQTTTDWGAPCVWLWDDALEEGGIQFARAIEAKLREKNA